MVFYPRSQARWTTGLFINKLSRWRNQKTINKRYEGADAAVIDGTEYAKHVIRPLRVIPHCLDLNLIRSARRRQYL